MICQQLGDDGDFVWGDVACCCEEIKQNRKSVVWVLFVTNSVESHEADLVFRGNSRGLDKVLECSKVLVVVVVADQALFKFRHVKQRFGADSARQLSNESNVLR